MTESVIRSRVVAAESGTVFALCTILLLPGLCLLAEISGTAAYVAFLLASTALFLFVRASLARFQKITLVGIFGILAVVHCCFGYLIAFPTTDILPQLGDITLYYPI